MAHEPPPSAFTSGLPVNSLQKIADPGDYGPVWARRYNSDRDVESPWSRKIILSLDGGGVRGYASLLILKDIMRRVEDLEKKRPLRPNRHMSSLNGSIVGANTIVDHASIALTDSGDECESSASYFWQKPPQEPQDYEPDKQDAFRPHHYFDYFFGTSTGGLSAIMLGRLQMPIREALNQYDTVCSRVFQRRSKLKIKATWGGKLAPRYSKKQMEEVLQFVTQRDRRDVKDRQLATSNESREASSSKHVKQETERKAKKVRLANSNPHASRTAVLTYGGYESLELRMFRSYRHPAPKSSNDANQSLDVPLPTENHIKPYAPFELPLWMAGRATSAAPSYFQHMQIDNEKYWDGGAGGANNPVKYAFNEVRQMHPRHQPLLIVSIGTGIPKDPSTKRRKVIEHTGDMLQLNKDFKTAILNSEAEHRSFERELGELNDRIMSEARIKCVAKERATKACVKYFRFNVPAASNITDVKLGHWHGKRGAETILKLQNAVEDYLRQADASLQRCAEILVEARRERQLTEHWESFALHLVYGCQEKVDDRDCSEPDLDSRTELRRHLLRDHGIAWQVPCRDHTGKDIHGWTCLWGECGERYVTIFENKDDYIQHLKTQHWLSDPQVVGTRDFEEKLDSGRKRKPPMSPHPTIGTKRTGTHVSQHSIGRRVLSM